jgi:hypothetical protein
MRDLNLIQYEVIKELTQEEYGWLLRDYHVGEIVWEFDGATYGCISREGVAISEIPGEGPFCEFPLDAIREVI